MKGIFIAFDQAHRDEVVAGLASCMQHGYTMFPDTWGRGSNGGIPHYGSHAWPGQNSATDYLSQWSENPRYFGLSLFFQPIFILFPLKICFFLKFFLYLRRE